MKIIKTALLVFVVLILILMITAGVVPNSFEVERSVTLNQSKLSVYNYLKLLKNQDQFSVWAQIDPGMKKEFRGQDGTVGFVSAWESDHPDVGKGEQEILKISEGERIEYELRFFEPYESSSPAFIAIDSLSANQTQVTWGFYGEMPYPMGLMLLFVDMEEELGTQLAKGLNNLKNILEK